MKGRIVVGYGAAGFLVLADTLIVLGALTLFGEAILDASVSRHWLLLAIALIPTVLYLGILYMSVHEAHSERTHHWASPSRALLCAGQGFGISTAGFVLSIVTALAVLVMAGGIF